MGDLHFSCLLWCLTQLSSFYLCFSSPHTLPTLNSKPFLAALSTSAKFIHIRSQGLVRIQYTDYRIPPGSPPSAAFISVSSPKSFWTRTEKLSSELGEKHTPYLLHFWVVSWTFWGWFSELQGWLLCSSRHSWTSKITGCTLYTSLFVPMKIIWNWLLKLRATGASLTKIEGMQAPVALNFSSWPSCLLLSGQGIHPRMLT